MSPAIVSGSAPTNGHGPKRGHGDGFGTRAIHAGSEPNPLTGAVIPPISLSTTYKQDGIGNHKVSLSEILTPTGVRAKGVAVRGAPSFALARHSAFVSRAFLPIDVVLRKHQEMLLTRHTGFRVLPIREP